MNIWDTKVIVVIIVCVIAVVVAFSIGTESKPKPADVIVTDENWEHVNGQYFLLHYVVSGHISNQGGSDSKHILLSLRITNNDTGTILYQTTISPIPAILSPGENGTFSIPFTSDDIGTEARHMTYLVSVVSE